MTGSALIDGLIADGSLSLVALAMIAAEVLALLALSQRFPTLNRRAIVANAFSGAGLLLALRVALLGGGSAAVAFWLGLSLLAHLADVAARLRR